MITYKKIIKEEQFIDWSKVELKDFPKLLLMKEVWIGKSWKSFLLNSLWFLAIIFIVYGYQTNCMIGHEIEANPCAYSDNITKACMDSLNIISVDILNKGGDNETKGSEFVARSSG